jgi:hypothetical protein
MFLRDNGHCLNPSVIGDVLLFQLRDEFWRRLDAQFFGHEIGHDAKICVVAIGREGCRRIRAGALLIGRVDVRSNVTGVPLITECAIKSILVACRTVEFYHPPFITLKASVVIIIRRSRVGRVRLIIIAARRQNTKWNKALWAAYTFWNERTN